MSAMPKPKRFLDRNDIAQLLECSVQSVRRNEESWGIAAFRLKFNDRTIRFHTTVTLQQLRKLGFLTKDEP